MYKLTTLFVSIVLLIVAGGVMAQDELPIEELCGADGKAFMAEQFQLLADNFETAEDDAIKSALHILSGLVGSYQAQCNGFVFSSDDYDNVDQVLGPIEFPDGFYRVTFESPEYSLVSVDTLSGGCGFVSSLIVGGGESTDSDVWEFEDNCRALLNIDPTGDWTLTIEPVQ